MPHSSGGGSHGGGCHGGSHGGIYGGHGVKTPRISKYYFKGSRRFMYHDRDGNPCYIYSDREPVKQTLGRLIRTLIFIVPFAFCGLILTIYGFAEQIPLGPLTPEYEEYHVHMNDSSNVIENESELERSLQAFQKETGICPYVMTVYDNDWKDTGKTLEQYAYSLYVDHFSDEQHFLIVYSEPEAAQNLQFVDWSWEGIQGDDTDWILTTHKFSRFQQDLQKYLTIDTISVGQALEKAFTNSLSYIMSNKDRSSEGKTLIAISFFLNLFSWLSIVFIIKNYKKSHRDYKEVPAETIVCNRKK